MDLAAFLAQQIGVGFVFGWATGRGLVPIINRVRLTATGLYPMLTLGNNKIALKRDLRRFHDGLAWLGRSACS